MGCVYLARNRVNNKRYVGKTTQKLSRRVSQHASCVKRIGRNTAISRALDKYGPEQFEWTILFESNDDAQLMTVEVQMISMLQTRAPRGYNLTNGGEGATGRIVPPEIRAKYSAAGKGHICSAITRSKISDANKGRPLSNEHRAKLSVASRGHVHSPEHRAKISASMMGQKRSLESRAKMCAAQRGRSFSPESIAKMSVAQKNRFAKARTAK